MDGVCNILEIITLNDIGVFGLKGEHDCIEELY